jgi:iron(III) transport system substrate-binding protein
MRAKLSVVATAAISSLIIVAACGGSPTDQSADAVGEGAADDLQGVYAELQGLQGDEYRQRLEELAEDEDADLTWYTSMDLEDSKPFTDKFHEAYPDIDVEIYRASSSDVMQRILQESSAGYKGADMIALNGPEMQVLAGKKLLLPLKTPTREEIYGPAQFPTWLGIYLNSFVTAWNTDGMSSSEAPKTWEDVLTNYDGRIAMELGDWDWFATLIDGYFTKELGMTEEQAIQLFHDAADGATFIDGHTTMAQLLAAGQFDIVASAYMHRIKQLSEDGAPVAFEPPVEPVVVRPNGIGVYRDTDAPATTLLFIEYALNEGQEGIVDVSRTPANTSYGKIPPSLDTLTIDFDKMNAERSKWEKLYEQVTEESGEKVIEGD